MTEYKFHYSQDASTPKMNINNNWGYTMADIKVETLVQTPQLLITEMHYPNGFKIKTEAQAHLINFYTTHPLKRNEDGSFTPDMDV